MHIGLIGAPNKGKSTIFSAMTLNEVEIAAYPFTTISPNLGVAHATRPCPDKELGVKCNPRNSLCINGVRHIPINITDIAGLVPEAHLGRGMGTQFLNDIMGADLVIQVVDLSGQTDISGNQGSGFDPSVEVKMVKEEMANWLAEIIARHASSLSRKEDGVLALTELLSAFKASEGEVEGAIKENALSSSDISWDQPARYGFAASFLKRNKPMVIAANKLDKASGGSLESLKSKLKDYTVIGCSGAIELALRKAAKSGVIRYEPGSASFIITETANSQQREALKYMEEYLKKNKSTGITELIDYSVFQAMGNIVVYPVENESRYTDHDGNVLPDAHLMRRGSTALDLARRIHTDIANRMIYAVDAKSKKRLAKDYVLQDGDVVKIVTAAK